MLVFAGSDTTAIILAAFFYHLLKNPFVYAPLHSEIGTAMSSRACTKNSIPSAHARALPYLSACISETFRVHPAAGFNIERVVVSPGRTISGSLVPSGTIVIVSTWALHYSREACGEDGEQFRPERWIEDKDKTTNTGKHLSHFGAGNHLEMHAPKNGGRGRIIHL